MNPKMIKKSHIVAYDGVEDTSLVRELEMAVDALVTFAPPYCAQFFEDLGLYGLQEAKAYLLRFLEEKGHHDHDAEVKFHEVYDKIVKAFQ